MTIARTTWLLTATLVLTVLSNLAVAQTPEIVRVEEDWELTLDEPDANSTAPQVTSVLSPLGHTNGVHATFELNHRTQPSFSSGGMQIQVWLGDEPYTARPFPGDETFSQQNEVVRWTQAMAVNNSSLLFEILNGESATWGPFGGQGYLHVVMPTELSNLNDYHPDVSVSQSDIGYASNRVRRLALLRVRFHLSTGDVVEDDTLRVVFEK